MVMARLFMARCAIDELSAQRCCSAVAAQVDHRIGEEFERVVHVTDAFNAAADGGTCLSGQRRAHWS
jgi:hypothetical protein